MSLQVVEQWYQKIPSIEKNQPLIISGSSVYSPNQVLDEVRKGTALGNVLQKVIETRSFTDAIDKYALAIARLKERLAKMPADTRIVWSQRSYSPQQMLKEIQDGTKVGRSMIEAEANRVEEVLK